MRARAFEATRLALPHACKSLVESVTDPLGEIGYIPWAREYVMNRIDGALTSISFCPFCGTAFPPDLRDEYFDRFDVDRPPFGPDGDQWWRSDPSLTIPDLLCVETRPLERVERELTTWERAIITTASREALGHAVTAGILANPTVSAALVGFDFVLPREPRTQALHAGTFTLTSTDGYLVTLEMIGDTLARFSISAPSGLPIATGDLASTRWELAAGEIGGEGAPYSS